MRPQLASLVFALPAAALCLAAIARPAAACSPPPPLWVTEPLQEPIAGIPTRGLVPLFAHADGFVELADIEFVVSDPDGTDVQGALEFFSDDRLVWRADEPLQATATYRVSLRYLGSELRSFSFVTAADDSVPALGLGQSALQLREKHVVTEKICCDGDIDSCGQEYFDHCWNQAVRSQWVLSGQLAFTPGAGRFYGFAINGEQTPASSIDSSPNGAPFYAIWDARRDDYCVDVSVTSLESGDVVSETLCQLDEAREPLEPFVPESPEWGECEDPPVNPNTGEEVQPPGGCSAAGGAAPWLPLLALVALRRRRQLFPSR